MFTDDMIVYTGKSQIIDQRQNKTKAGTNKEIHAKFQSTVLIHKSLYTSNEKF